MQTDTVVFEAAWRQTEADLKKSRLENERLRAALIEVREKLMSNNNPLHAIENALVPLDFALNHKDHD